MKQTIIKPKRLRRKIEEFSRTRSISLACEIVDEIDEWINVRNCRFFAINGDIKIGDFLDLFEEQLEIREK